MISFPRRNRGCIGILIASFYSFFTFFFSLLFVPEINSQAVSFGSNSNSVLLGSNSMLSGSKRNSNRHACAACKHQRKKCNPDECVLAPYFPASKAEEFQAVHKVFGVKNLANMLVKLDVRDRHTAVNSYVWEALLWVRDPVNGPLGNYRRLEQQLQSVIDQYKDLQRTTFYMPGLRFPGVVHGNSEEREAIFNCHNNVQNSYASHQVQKEVIEGQEVTCNIIPPQSTTVQGGQERLLNQGRGITIADQSVSLAHQPAADQRERQRNILLDGGSASSSINRASSHPVQQEELRTNPYNSHPLLNEGLRINPYNAAAAQGTNHHGREFGINVVNSNSFWQGQEKGLDPIYYPQPCNWINQLNIDPFAVQQQQLNNDQSYNIQDENNQLRSDNRG